MSTGNEDILRDLTGLVHAFRSNDEAAYAAVVEQLDVAELRAMLAASIGVMDGICQKLGVDWGFVE